LRAYGTKPLIWDGQPGCEHRWEKRLAGHHPRQVEQTKWKTAEASARGQTASAGSFCFGCGAWKGQLGLEPTPGLYINHLCSIFDEVKRVLKKTGTCWVVIGDTYSGSGCGTNDYITEASRTLQCTGKRAELHKTGGISQKLKSPLPKSLCLIPARFSVEMTNRGWVLRNEIVWWKPNCLPSSVKDRFTVDFEKILFFVKSKKYYFNQQLEPLSETTANDRRMGMERFEYRGKRLRRERETQKREVSASFWFASHLGRNKRCVWRIPNQPFSGAHFAVFPEALVETPIKAGCPEEVCIRCGQPKEKVYSTRQEFRGWDDEYWRRFLVGNCHSNSRYKQALRVMKDWMTQNDCFDYSAFYGWWKGEMHGKWESGNLEAGQASKMKGSLPFPRPEKRLRREVAGHSSCSCNAGFRSGIVLDPFAGSGTTCLVAKRLRRDFIAVDASPAYCGLARKRLKRRA
jgi:DNA modification methylase